MRPILVLCLLLALAACGARPLTEGERAFAETVVGRAVALDEVVIVRGSASALIPTTVPVRPRDTCRTRIAPPRDRPVPGLYPAFVLGDRIHVARDFWARDFAPDYPDALQLEAAMRLAHELVHVWQWQARGLTGYGPQRALAEHVALDDPYLTELEPGRGFLDYGWEQQGALVEEFVCCRALDPAAPRTNRLAALVGEVFPEAERRPRVPPAAVRLRWPEAERTGICR